MLALDELLLVYEGVLLMAGADRLTVARLGVFFALVVLADFLGMGTFL